MQLAERLRADIESQTMDVAGCDNLLRCTVTIGISRQFADLQGLEQAMREADAALYRGKSAGRNRIGSAQASQPSQLEALVDS